MSRRSRTYRGDLLRALAVSPYEDAATIAGVCGFVAVRNAIDRPEPAGPVQVVPYQLNRDPEPRDTKAVVLPASAHYLRAVKFETLQPLEHQDKPTPFTDSELSEKPDFRAPEPTPLMPYSRLLPYLRRAVGARRMGKRVNERALTKSIASLSAHRRIPRRRVPCWPYRITLAVDARMSHSRFWEDIWPLHRRLESLVGRGMCPIRTWDGDPDQFSIGSNDDGHTIVIGDMGCLDDDRSLIDTWTRYVHEKGRWAARSTFLMPCPRSRWEPQLVRGLRTICWDRYERLPASRKGQRPAQPVDTAQRQKDVRELLARIAPALRVEPALLRDIRLAGGDRRLDIGAEYDVGCEDPSTVASFFNTIAVSSSQACALLQEFAKLPDTTRLAVAAAITRHHKGCSVPYCAEEALNVAITGTVISEQMNSDKAEENRRQLVETLEQAFFAGEPLSKQRELAEWLLRYLRRGSPDLLGVPYLAGAWVLAKYVLSGEIPSDPPAEIDLKSAGVMADRITRFKFAPLKLRLLQTPAGIAARELDQPLCPGEHTCAHLTGHGLAFTPDGEEGEKSRTIRVLASRSRSVEIPLERPEGVNVESEYARVELQPWNIPAWASAAGCDEFGDYVEFELKDVLFRFRWVPPGAFVRGSPENEPGRWEAEGPEHAVTITRGFWLGETPVTQAQWMAVTGNNPSNFKGDRRPVENANWIDCREYCNGLSAALTELGPYKDLSIRLPTEAEWEYACRAGTDSAFNDGSPCTAPSGLDPALDKLGWFDENSKKSTHEVGEKEPNGWGLFDMHGNVFEWCLDAWADRYDDGPQADPYRDGVEGAFRVVRGGGWRDDAGDCRSACRDWNDPGNRDSFLGFRLLVGQEPKAEWQRRVVGSAERVPRDEAPDGVTPATKPGLLSRLFKGRTPRKK